MIGMPASASLSQLKSFFWRERALAGTFFKRLFSSLEVGGEIIQFDPRIVTFAVGGSVAIEVDELPIAFPDGAEGFDS